MTTGDSIHIFSNKLLNAFRERLAEFQEVDARNYSRYFTPQKNPNTSIATRTLKFDGLPPRLQKSIKKIRALEITNKEVLIISDIMNNLQGYSWTKVSENNAVKDIRWMLERMELRRAILCSDWFK
jgi:hypothetical protein